jgi:putative ABC transport system substrate-binding protein
MRRRDFSTLLGGVATVWTIWPSLLSAQQKATPVIGYLGIATPSVAAPNVAALRQGLSETGYVEGQNLTIEYCWAEGRYDRLPALAANLVGRKVDVIVADGPPRGTRGEKCNVDDPYRLRQRARPGRARSGRQPGPAGRQRHGRQHPHCRAESQAV